MADESQWRRCSACKNSIALGAAYWTCNVSTCNRKRTGLVFCTVSCWEVHLPGAKHRQSWAVEQKAPMTPQADEPAPSGGAGEVPRREPRRIVPSTPARQADPQVPRETLIIGSRLKDYVRARSGFSTSDRVLSPLSDIVRRACDEAIRNASLEGRKTVLDRDVPEE